MFHYRVSQLHDSITFSFKKRYYTIIHKIFSAYTSDKARYFARVLAHEFKILPARAQKYKKEIR